MMMLTRHKHTLLWFSGVFTTVAFFLGLSYLVSPWTEKTSNPRVPASVAPKAKEEVLKGTSESTRFPSGKATAPVKIEIHSLNGAVQAAGTSISLEATIETKSEEPNLEYAWILPRGVVPAAGGISGILRPLNAGETISVTLSAISNVAENRQIHLHVFKRVNGEAQGHIAQYNTVNQVELDQQLRTKAEILGTAAEIDGGFKIMQ